MAWACMAASVTDSLPFINDVTHGSRMNAQVYINIVCQFMEKCIKSNWKELEKRTMSQSTLQTQQRTSK